MKSICIHLNHMFSLYFWRFIFQIDMLMCDRLLRRHKETWVNHPFFLKIHAGARLFIFIFYFFRDTDSYSEVSNSCCILWVYTYLFSGEGRDGWRGYRVHVGSASFTFTSNELTVDDGPCPGIGLLFCRKWLIVAVLLDQKGNLDKGFYRKCWHILISSLC